MKTASEYQRDYDSELREVAAEHRRRVTQWLILVEATPRALYPGATEDLRRDARGRLANGYIRLLGLACDHCGVELASNGNLLLSDPPRRHAACVGCGWVGSVAT